MAQLQANVQDTDAQNMLNNFKATQVEYVNVVRQTVGLAKNGQMLDAQSLAVEKMQPLQIRLFEEISSMIQTQQASTTSAAAASTASARSAGDALLMIAAVAALLGIAIARLFTRYIKRQLGENPLMRCRSSMKLRREIWPPGSCLPRMTAPVCWQGWMRCDKA